MLGAGAMLLVDVLRIASHLAHVAEYFVGLTVGLAFFLEMLLASLVVFLLRRRSECDFTDIAVKLFR